MGAAIDTGAAIAIRRVRDLEFFLDQLAMLEWKNGGSGIRNPAQGRLERNRPGCRQRSPGAQARRNIVTFARKRSGAWPPTSMDRKRPQLSIDELRQLRWLLGGLLVLISVATVGYMEIDAWLLATVTTVAVLRRWPGRICRRACHPSRIALLFRSSWRCSRGFLLQRAAVAGNGSPGLTCSCCIAA